MAGTAASRPSTQLAFQTLVAAVLVIAFQGTVVNGVSECVQNEEWRLEADDWKVLQAGTSRECCVLCSLETMCTAWEYRNTSCYMKNLVLNENVEFGYHADYISGTRAKDIAGMHGAVVAWGSALSNGMISYPTGLGANVAQVAAGAQHGLALLGNGSVIGFGSNEHGQISIPAAAQTGPIISIAAGSNVSAAITQDLSLLVWGEGRYQQDLPPIILQMGVTAVAVGGAHMLAIRADTRGVVSWGRGLFGDITVPATASSGMKAVAAGLGHSLAVSEEGQLIAWGNATYGAGRLHPDAASFKFVAIAVGVRHSLALTTDGHLLCWGDNSFNQCDMPPGLSATNPAASLQATAISAGSYHSVAVLSNGTVVAWGWAGADIQPPAALHNIGAAGVAAGRQLTLAISGKAASAPPAKPGPPVQLIDVGTSEESPSAGTDTVRLIIGPVFGGTVFVIAAVFALQMIRHRTRCAKNKVVHECIARPSQSIANDPGQPKVSISMDDSEDQQPGSPHGSQHTIAYTRVAVNSPTGARSNRKIELEGCSWPTSPIAGPSSIDSRSPEILDRQETVRHTPVPAQSSLATSDDMPTTPTLAEWPHNAPRTLMGLATRAASFSNSQDNTGFIELQRPYQQQQPLTSPCAPSTRQEGSVRPTSPAAPQTFQTAYSFGMAAPDFTRVSYQDISITSLGSYQTAQSFAGSQPGTRVMMPSSFPPPPPLPSLQ